MAVKRKPHHNLAAVKAKFADVVEAVQALETKDFIKSETAHNPSNSKVWHDTYNLPWDGLLLYLKFAGETLIDLTLTSFKTVEND